MKFGLNQMMKTENDDIVADSVAGGVATDVVADSQEAVQEVAEIEEIAMAVENYGEQLAGVEDLAVQHDVQVQVMDGDLSVNNHGKIENDGAEINIDIDAKELGASVGDDAGDVLTPESTDEQAEEAAAKLENDLSAALANIGGSLRSSRFSTSLLGQKFENDMSRLKGKKKYRYLATEGIGDVAKKIWEKIKAFFKMIWTKIKEAASRFMQMFKANKTVLMELKEKLNGMSSDDFAKCDKEKVGDALKAITYAHNHHKGETVPKNLSGSGDVFDKLLEIVDDGNRKAIFAAFNAMAQEVATDKQDLNHSLFEGLEKNAKYKYICPVPNGIAVVMTTGDETKGIEDMNASVKVIKLKKEEFSSASDKRSALIDLATDGIEMCNALEKDGFKEFEKAITDFQSKLETSISKFEDQEKEKFEGKEHLPAVSKHQGGISTMRRIAPMLISSIYQSLTQVSKSPSAYVAGVRNGMSACSSKK